ncbi:MAG: LD-carboxypeptidase, partial [Nitriliruptorales bacterium]|nr:LD-carboxypeptidase [Nitriliruptorales bacterium]
MSPSPDPHGELERGLECLREMGFEPVLAEHALAETGYTAGSAEQRAADINAMFADPSIRAIIASHGGQVAHGVLPHLDWDAMRTNPTIFMGFSNITTLNLAIHARTGLVTFNGNMVMWHLGMEPTDYDLDEFRAVLMDGRSGRVPKNSSWVTVRDGDARPGRLVGDALGLRGLAQTAYQVPFDDDLLL